MKKGTRLTNDDGVQYELLTKLGEGGFGETYRAIELADTDDKVREVCLKICASRRDWHGEAFYGELLVGNKRVVQLLDAFVDVSRSRSGNRRTYCLVFELMPHGTINDLLSAQPGRPFMSEVMVRREISALLTLLGTMHNAGITHRDIKPANVYVKSRKLILGDFGISEMTLTPHHRAADAFTPDFSPRNARELRQWGPRHDIFQVALLAASLLTGKVWTTKSLARLQRSELPDDVKCWIWHATSGRARGYDDALDAQDALRELQSVSMRPGRAPAGLRGECVVLTGKLDDMNRTEAASMLRSAGAVVQEMVSDRTTLVVRGTVRNGLSEHEGRKLFQVRERRRQGQTLKIISGSQLASMTERA
ncbi:serine/threonine protein kinase [Rhodococcus sp. Eu-32]|uniref:protein kinase domain-containing protein n=1 Tax=Rhodococcus sp. Eu-32 TaxID=1017319 RepID=UPI000DF4B196|nr:protein kinase [Rhodococcus sp. Eu-32]RRQ27393.1 serine/threonine protein kinase [Rhodococcus sp. Eu-32]